MRAEIMTRMEISLDAILHNYQQVCEHTAPARVFAVVKSEAYGHGAVPVAHALQGAGCEEFAVAMVDEGMQLRRAGITGEIMVMGAILPEQMLAMAQHDLVPVLPDASRMHSWNRMARDLGRRLTYHIKVDVGLGRMGFMPEDGDRAAGLARQLADIELVGIGSHLSYPGGPLEVNDRELARYLSFVIPFTDHFPHLARHLAASQAAARFPNMHMDMVRVGGLLYGIQHVADSPLQLQPALEFKTVVAQVRQLPKGWHVGYNLAKVLSEPTRVALLPMGWTDGLTSTQIGHAQLLIREEYCPLIGLCTDFAMVDVSHVDDVKTGDEVVLIGRQGERSLSAIDLGAAGGMSTGQLLGKVSLRVPRVYTRYGQTGHELSLLHQS